MMQKPIKLCGLLRSVRSMSFIHYSTVLLPTLGETFYHKDLIVDVIPPDQAKPKRPLSEISFGEEFTDHMFEVEWTAKNGWDKPKILPFHDLVLHPAAKVLHYAVEAFEGMKAYRGVDGKVRLFRPELNVHRFLQSTERCCLPKFDGQEFSKCLFELIRLDKDWVPQAPVGSLYIRPTIIGTEPTIGIGMPKHCLLYIIGGPVGSYWKCDGSQLKPITLYANPNVVRAWYGGAGQFKIGSNYGVALYHLKEAHRYGCAQNLWLFGDRQVITEAGAMNLFVFWINESGDKELITAPLDGLVLPGVTRRSIIELATEWGKFKVTEKHYTMQQLIIALNENRVLEIFGSGTAATVCPVDKILYQNGIALTELAIPTMKNPWLTNQLYKSIIDIQTGVTQHSNWTTVV